jgi:hypothetical protein
VFVATLVGDLAEFNASQPATSEAQLTDKQKDLLEWVNTQLAKITKGPPPPVKNLSHDFRSGVVLIRLFEVFQCDILMNESLNEISY